MKPGYQPCPDCCACPAPTLLAATVSVSRSKGGFCGFVPGPATDCAIAGYYLTATYSGREGLSSNCYSGQSKFDATNNLAFSTTGKRDVACDGTTVFDWTSGGPYPIYVSATQTRTYDGEYIAYIDLSDEFTTDLLKTVALAALPDYPAYPTPPPYHVPVASYNLSDDETSLYLERSKYQFQFAAPKVGSGKCYKLTWVERFTPADGGDPVDTEKSFTWDGDASGYDPADVTTWPVSDTYTLDVPDSNGETTIGYYTDPADPTTFVHDYIFAACVGCSA